MFTVCPKCALILSITARDLRAAHGHVRCGRCQNVFNALDSLSEEHPHAPSRGKPPEAPQESASHCTSDPEPDAEQSPAAASAPLGQEVTTTAAPETPAAEEIAVEFEAADVTAPPPAALQPQPPAAEQQRPEAAFELEPEAPHARRFWTVGTALLAVLLALQIINHYRGTLATFPSVGAPLRLAYGALGIKLMPAWNVHAYEARQLGATISGTNPDELTVRASIANLAPRPQPLPLLRVTLQDRFGRSIAARDVPPRDYLPSVPAPPLLAPGGRIDASVTFLNPDPRAVGFVIDACLPERHTVVCAHGS